MLLPLPPPPKNRDSHTAVVTFTNKYMLAYITAEFGIVNHCPVLRYYLMYNDYRKRNHVRNITIIFDRCGCSSTIWMCFEESLKCVCIIGNIAMEKIGIGALVPQIQNLPPHLPSRWHRDSIPRLPGGEHPYLHSKEIHSTLTTKPESVRTKIHSHLENHSLNLQFYCFFLSLLLFQQIWSANVW